MTETERLCDELRRALDGPAWHGPALREVLAGVDAATASARPIAGAHTIWELVRHLAAWLQVVRDRLDGRPLPEPEEGDWPPVDATDEAAWLSALALLTSRQEALLDAVRALPPERLDAPLYEGSSTAYATLHGLAQHYAYHGGQIVLLKKALGRSSG